ncbi:uncharacterized protein G2W53_037409 [Senna tora]|uniref:Uncharacterized protein n=1 Tax=Senna tora TaxID=362788 RepID=A0A834W9L8_9FABA|nr:uncharacterized protein G2W53_037409 [Senna tora]
MEEEEELATLIGVPLKRWKHYGLIFR